MIRLGGRLAGLVLTAATLVAACQAPRAPRHFSVRIEGLRFQPDTLAVQPGDTITWLNGDIVPHTVTSEAGGWDSGMLAAGASYQLVVGPALPESYHCTYHPSMGGRLIVAGR